MNHHQIFRVVGFILLTTSTIGCSALSPSCPPSDPSNTYLRHSIRTGESLGLVARWYTGNEQLWRRFYLPAPTSGAKHLQVDDIILIPMSIVAKTEPPSELFRAQYLAALRARSGKKRQVAERPGSRPAGTRPQRIEDEETPVPDVLSHAEQELPMHKNPAPANETADPVDLEREFMEQIIKP